MQVCFQYWNCPDEQISSRPIWLPIPYLPHRMPHVGLHNTVPGKQSHAQILGVMDHAKKAQEFSGSSVMLFLVS